MKGAFLKRTGLLAASLLTAVSFITGCSDDGVVVPSGNGGGGSSAGNNSSQQSESLSIDLSTDKTDILINTTETVTFTAKTTGCSAESLTLSDEQGTEAAVLTDDGKGADEKAGDGIYTAAQEMNRSEVEQKEYRIIHNEVSSNICYVSFFKNITDDEWVSFDTAEAAIRTMTESSEQTPELLEDIRAYMEQCGYFRNIEIKGDTISAMTDFGVNCFYQLKDETGELKGSTAAAQAPSVMPSIMRTNSTGAGSSSDEKIESILVLRPFSQQFTYTTYVDVAKMIASSYGTNATTVTVIEDDNVTVETMKTFDDYDMVLYDSHGTLASSWNTAWAWFDENNGNPYLCTREYYSANRAIFSSDYATGRIVVDFGGGEAAVGYKFFETYYSDNSFDDTFVYLGSCYSMYNSTIAETLVKKGAAVVFGWSDVVSTTYDCPMLTTLMLELLDGKTAYDSMQAAMSEHGVVDSHNSSTRMCIHGDWEYKLPGKGHDFGGQGMISGTIYDGTYGNGVSGAEISVFSGSECIGTVTTDANGYFELLADEGTYSVEVSAEGYEGLTTENVVTEPDIITDVSEVMYQLLADFTLPSEFEIGLGANEEIAVICSPPEADLSAIRWSSSDSSVVSVLEQGIITGHKLGTAVITAEADINGTTVTRECTVTVSNRSRDCVLVLDFSGSMSGTPQRELREAAKKFCQDVVADSSANRVGIVVFGSDVDTYPLTSDLNELLTIIDNAHDGGGTNMDGGMQAADSLLEQMGRTSAEKNVIIMADGIPNDESAVYNLAPVLMDKYNTYSLGFYHSYSDPDQVALLKAIQNDGYYEVVNGEDLAFAFGDIAGEINDGSKIVIQIACPVDVTITSNGQTLSSADENTLVADFGKIELFGQDKDIKIVTLDEGTDYEISLNGTGAGTMDYSIRHYSEDDQIVDSRSFRDVPLTSSTRISTDTVIQDEVKLDIDSNGDGVSDSVWTCGENEEISVEENKPEKPQGGSAPIVADDDDPTVLIITLIVAGVAIIIVVAALVSAAAKKGRESAYGASRSGRGIQGENLTRLVAPPETTICIRSGELLIAEGSMRTSVIKINDGELFVIGKDSRKANIVLAEDYTKVSRIHCSVKYVSSADSYIVTDLSSTNGTYLSNGVRLKPNTPIYVKQGEAITLGDKGCVIKLR